MGQYRPHMNANESCNLDAAPGLAIALRKARLKLVMFVRDSLAVGDSNVAATEAAKVRR